MNGLKSYGNKIHAVAKVLEPVKYRWHIEHHAYAMCGYLGYANNVDEDAEVTCKKCLKKLKEESQ